MSCVETDARGVCWYGRVSHVSKRDACHESPDSAIAPPTLFKSSEQLLLTSNNTHSIDDAQLKIVYELQAVHFALLIHAASSMRMHVSLAAVMLLG